jgi:hypothetical protein
MGHNLVDPPCDQLPSNWERDNFVNSRNDSCTNIDGSNYCSFVDIENLELCSGTIVKGRLRENISFWESIGTNRWVLEIIREGYCLPFIDMPEQVVLSNHRSAFKSSKFVTQEIAKLRLSGVLVEVKAHELTVCNPLVVVFNNAQKPRLILDLRYVNKHLRSCKFQYEDIRTAANLFIKGDLFFKFDYASGYHHIEISLSIPNFLVAHGRLMGPKKVLNLQSSHLVCPLARMYFLKCRGL